MMNVFESPMSEDRLSELHQLATAALNENLSDEQAARLDQLVCQDEEFRKQYIRYMYVSWNLRTWAKFPLADDSESPLQPSMPTDVDEALLRQLQVPSSEPAAPSVPSFLGNFVHGTIGFFSQEVPFAMLTATIITSLGLLAGSFVYVSHHESTAQKSQPSSPSVATVSSSQFEHIGRITGMVDVKWSDINTSTELGNAVSLGRRYALSSGLMEITYDSGAKVILQGPVTYKVDSSAGGFLSVGKLTAKLEKRGEGRGERKQNLSAISGQQSEKVASGQKLVSSGQWLVASEERSEVRGQGPEKVAGESDTKSRNPEISKSQISNPQSLIPNHLLSPAPAFAVRTPTATVTDLGTEFGVEVRDSGATTARVFQGVVELKTNGDSKRPSQTIRLLADESAEIEKVEQNGIANYNVLRNHTHKVTFTRDISEKTLIQLDLADVVAGGSGLGNASNRGINPQTGAIQISPATTTPDFNLRGDGLYHRVEGLPMVDGVFIPAGNKGPVQLDSANHTFEFLLETDNSTQGYIWTLGNGAANSVPKLDNGDFESPPIRDLVYTPPFRNPGLSGTGKWIFGPSGGKAYAGFTTANSAMGLLHCFGNQCAFIQGTGDFSQKIDGFQEGTYILSFYAESRDRHTNPLRVEIDGKPLTFNGIASAKPHAVGNAMQQFTSDPFTVAAGSHTISFAGTVPFQDNDDRTTFIDDVALWNAAQFPAEMGGVDFAGVKHAALMLFANKGITFDLEAVRHRYPGCHLLRFIAYVGNTEDAQHHQHPISADVWAFVDGRKRFQYGSLCCWNSPQKISIRLSENDRFLTLVSTESSNGKNGGWIVFGDPTLEMLPTAGK